MLSVTQATCQESIEGPILAVEGGTEEKNKKARIVSVTVEIQTGKHYCLSNFAWWFEMGWEIQIGKLYFSNHFAWWCGRGLAILPSTFHCKENFVVTVPRDQLNGVTACLCIIKTSLLAVKFCNNVLTMVPDIQSYLFYAPSPLSTVLKLIC
jgi:hypothetical protein